MELLTDFRLPETCERYRLIQYLDIACLGRRFGRTGLERWARKALYPVLVKSKYRLACEQWDKNTWLQLRSLTRSSFDDSDPLELAALTFIYYIVSTSTMEANAKATAGALGLDTCIQLYTDPTLLQRDPAVFGCVFAALLSLGYRTWESHLSGKHRTVLYTAQVQLTTLGELDSLDWILRPEAADRLLSTHYFRICNVCERKFEAIWNGIFGRYQSLKSSPRTALDGVAFLAQLPQYRQSLVNQWEDYRSSLKATRSREVSQANSLFTMITGSSSNESLTCSHPNGCTLSDELLADIDQHIQQVYEELASQYDRFAS